MSGLNITRERAETYSTINNLSLSRLLGLDWLAMYDLLKEIDDLDYPTDVRLARRFRDKIRAMCEAILMAVEGGE